MKTNIRSIIPVVVRVAGAIVTIGLTVYIARRFGVEYSGRFYYLMSVIAVFGVVTRLGTEQYLAHSVSERIRASEHGSPSEIFWSVVFSVFFITTFVFLLILFAELLFPTASVFSDRRLPNVIWLGGAVIGFNFVWTSSGFLRSLGYASLSIFMETALLSTWLLLFFVFKSLFGDVPVLQEITLMIFVLAPILAGFFLVFFPITYAGSSKILIGCRNAIKGLFGFSSVVITNSLIVWFPTIFLGFLGREADVGIYNAAFRVSMLVGSFAVIIKSDIIKKWVEFKRNGIDKRFTKKDVLYKSAKVMIPFVLISIVVTLQGDLLVKLFGTGFSKIRSIILILLLSQSLNVAGYVIETVAILEGKKDILNITAIATGLGAIIGAFVLIPRFGLQGAGWNFFCTVFICRVGMLFLWFTRKRIN